MSSMIVESSENPKNDAAARDVNLALNSWGG